MDGKIRTLLVCLLGIIQYGNLNCQTNHDLNALNDSLLRTATYSNETGSYVPNVILPSPETVSLFRSIDYSINNPQGVIPIDIPLYTVKCGSLTLPITLTYSSSGRKVSDVTGAVGLGWNLNIGGMVSRTIYGSPDESYSFPSDLKYASEYNLRSYPDYDFLATLVHFDRSSTDYSSYLDTEYDVFSYLVGSHSGHFVLDNYHPVMLNSASPLRINSATVSNVSITDENGVTYLFNKPAYSTTVFKGSIGQLTDFVTGANLTKMTSCDGKYAINLSYSTYEYNQAPSTYNYLSITDCTLDDYFYDYPYGCSSVKSQYDRVINASTVYSIYKVNRISQISFNGGTITFAQDSDKKILNMVVKNAQGNIVKTVNFEYLLVETGVYTLKRLIIDNVEKYDFEYSPSTQTTLFAKDYWGYKNDGPLFDNTIPSITLEDEHKTKIYGGGNSRLPSLGAAQDGVLIKIVYPTGGWTRFSYELNQYKHNSEMRYGGGLRVSKMTSADENGNVIEKSYEYGNDGSGYCDVHAEDAMRATDDVYVEYYSVGQSYYGHYRRRSFNFEFNDGLSYLAGKGIQYSLITEYTYNATKGENGKIEYYYSLGLPDIIAEYPSRGEVHRAPAGKVFVSSFNSFWNTSKLTGKKIYVKKGGGFELQKEIENNYDKTKTGQLRGLSVYPAMEFYNDNSYGYEKEAAYNGYEVFRFADYYIHIGKEQLSSTKETDYFQGGKVEKQTNYYYNDKGMPVKNVETYNAETITKEWTYYYENETGMKNLNLLSPLKNFETDYKNGTNTSNTIDFNTFTYQNWGGNVWAPSKIHTFSSGNTTPYITYHKYDDYGNPLHVTIDNSEEVVYVWGYNKQYLVAEIRNLPYTTVNAALNLNSFSSAIAPDYSKIDKLRRDYPKALIKSYIYKPLVGIITSIDVNGLKTTYEYDAASRLTAIKDHEGKVIQEFKYNYKR